MPNVLTTDSTGNVALVGVDVVVSKGAASAPGAASKLWSKVTKPDAPATGTVWDNVEATADSLPNTDIPATFKLKSGNKEFYVNSNATKHMGEYLQNSSNQINDQQLLSSFSSAVDDIVSSGTIKFNHVYKVDGWEIIFSQRPGDQLPVIKHALYRP